MAPMSKRRRSSKKVLDKQKEDLVTRLAADLLIGVLGLLPTLDAVRTCVLSSRWTNLWKSVDTFDFDESMILSDGIDFGNFVNRVLEYNTRSSIKKFKLKCHTAIDDLHLQRWIRHMVRHNVEGIDINMLTHQSSTLPQELLTCITLVSLRLEIHDDVNFPSSVFLPKLKFLDLSLPSPTNEMTQSLFCNCPVLEDLRINCTYIQNDEDIIFDISTPALKTLKLDLCSGDCFIMEVVHPRNKVVVNAPVLESLIVEDDYLASYVFRNLSSLVRAIIDVGTCCMEELGTQEHAYHLLTLLEGVTTVKFLTLHHSAMSVLDSTDGIELPLFHNLIHLDIYVYNCYNFVRLSDLIGSAPNLVTLELTMLYEHQEDKFDEFNWVEPPTRPACILSHLDEIRIYGFVGRRGEFAVLKYLIKNAKALKKVKVDSDLPMRKQRNFLKKLSMFKKSAESCQFELI